MRNATLAGMWRGPLLLGALVVSWCNCAMADDTDDWCAKVTKASNIVICSDAELRQQAETRNHLFEKARQILNPEAYRTLSHDQAAWVRMYTAACGVAVDGPITALPI